MRIARRPSKFVLWHYLTPDLARRGGEVGLDAASAEFKSYPLFRTARYFGFDTNLEALQRGREEFPAAVGLVGDLAEIELPPRSVDVCVSTNTLHWLEPARRQVAVERLAELVTPHGWLFMTIPADDGTVDDALRALRRTFFDVDVRYYGGFVARRYESWIEKRAYVDRQEGFFASLRVVVSVGLGWLEILSPLSTRRARGKQWAYLRCHGKRDGLPATAFSIDESRAVADGIYSASLVAS